MASPGSIPTGRSIDSSGMPAAVRRRPIASGASSRRTYWPIQAWLNLIGAPRGGGGRSCERLSEEAEVVLVEQADVVDAVLEHGDALDPQPEGEAAHHAGVVADLLEDRRVHHPGAAQLDPAAPLAARAAGARAEDAGDVVLGARLDEREERRTQAEPHLPLEDA